MTIRYLSLFSGVEAASVAWGGLGWECAAVSEIEPFPCAVLAHHYPDVPNLGDVTKVTEADIKALGKIDIVVFGSPCQDLSVAGKRAGLKGERSGLFTTAMQVIKWSGARFALWENVPGAFSSNKGDDFTAVVSDMAGLDGLSTPVDGWAKEGAAVGDGGLLEWAVLDAQWFGLAQRRKRVFAIVDFGDWTSRPPILLERESLRGDSAPSRETGQDFTADVRASTYREGGFGQFVETQAGGTVRASGGCLGGGSESLICCHGTQDPITNTETAYAMGCNSGQENVIAIAGNIIGRTDGNGGNGNGFDDSGACYTLTTNDRHAVVYCGTQNDALRDLGIEICLTLRAGHGGGAVNPMIVSSVVRRLTPVECERLQGFPDDYTKIPYRNKDADQCPDGPRYKAMGNSMAVPVMSYIGRKIVEALEYAAA